MLIDCSHCRARVDAKEIGTVRRGFDPECGSPDEDELVTLLRCQVCCQPILAFQSWEGEKRGWDGNHEIVWSSPQRVWPAPELSFSTAIPKAIQLSLLEAQKCLVVGAYTASVAMTGRALEAIGRHFHTKGNANKLMLAAGIEELRQNNIIDQRLYEWSKELHLNRNLAAHASSQEFEQADAEDLFNFASAICDYVFVLSEKFDKFKKRKGPNGTPAPPETAE
jgi:hypothetical protein